MEDAYEITLDTFSGGISDDPRLNAFGECAMVKHFDIHYSPKRLRPVRSFVADMHDGSSSTGMKQYNLRDFMWDRTNQRIWAVGTRSDGTGVKIAYRGINDSTWTVSNIAVSTPEANGNDTTDVLTLTSSNTSAFRISNGQAMTYTGTTRAGLVNGTVYYAGDVTTNSFKLYTTAALTTLVDITATGGTGSLTFSVSADTFSYPYTFWPGSAIYNEDLQSIYFIGNDAGMVRLVKYNITLATYTNIGSNITIAPSGESRTVMRPIFAPDANFYFGISNQNSYYRLTDTGTPAWSSVSALIPYGMFPSCQTNYGDFIAIGIQGSSTDGSNGIAHSRVHIYDMVNLDPVQVIDWGPGRLINLQNVDGTLIGVSEVYLNNALGNDEGQIAVRTWSGGTAVRAKTVKRIRALATGGIGGTYYSESRSEGISFYAKVPTNTAGTTFDEGIWNYGRRTANDPMALSLEVDTSNFTDADGVQSFAQIGNFLMVAHSGDGSIHRTADTATFAYTSIYESQIFSRGYENQMKNIEVTTEPLPAGATVTVKYRINGQTAWTDGLVFTGTGNTYEITTRPPSGEFPKFHEIQFRVESTGGGVPLKIRCQYHPLNSQSEDR